MNLDNEERKKGQEDPHKNPHAVLHLKRKMKKMTNLESIFVFVYTVHHAYYENSAATSASDNSQAKTNAISQTRLDDGNDKLGGR